MWFRCKQLNYYLRYFFVLIILWPLSSTTTFAKYSGTIPWQALKNTAQVNYGQAAQQRIESWRLLMMELKQASPAVQINRINRFFNQVVPFKHDKYHWSKADYWATPFELIVTNGGDCEDYAIAKYVSLMYLGIPPSQLFLGYTYSKTYDTPHMVLVYQAGKKANMLILDNIVENIFESTLRDDLTLIYKFNKSGIWNPNLDRHRSYIGSIAQLEHWVDMQQRIKKSGFRI